MQQFELVHSGYLSSFKEYKKIIKEAKDIDEMLEPLSKKVKEDNLFSANERQKLHSLTNWDDYGQSEEERLVANIVSYLLHTKSNMVEDLTFSQHWRNSLLFELRGGNWLKEHKDSTNKRKKEVLLNILDDIVEEMQHSYADVIESYVKLKTAYLDERQ